ncbi:MAG: aminotransferase DegT [Ponticaulis sp.]|nr:aminotransferase DegT [Ponticaulis sp.]|tara:strand:+ start:5439 stop:6593 length:1155 start_codon:yes stop_codon:yes gene_type:complete
MQFIDLHAQRARIETEVNTAIANVLAHGMFVMGPEVREFEAQMAAFSGAKHALGCANGTDALALPLMAWGLRPGDAVFCPSFTFCATAEVVPWLGAEPVFVEILPDTFNMDPAHLEACIEAVIAEGRLTPKVIIAVDLFGQSADHPAMRRIADKYGLKLIADSAQGFGTTLDGKHPSDWADIVTTSFFPAKPLGCYGDGGAVVTNDDELAELLDSIRIHGKVTPSDLKDQTFEHDPKYFNMRIGMNSRLDSIQAAILIEKLKIFPDEIELRNNVADRYAEGLKGSVLSVPGTPENVVSVWAQYVIDHENRDGLQAHLKSQGVPSAVYYPVPMHVNGAYARYTAGAGDLKVTEAKMATVLALPMHPYLSEEDQDKVIEAVRSFNG